MRLNKRIAISGLCSRREADSWISSGRVEVNGQVCLEHGTQVADRDVVTVDGVALPDIPERKVYLFHKPIGYTCTHDDTHAERSIYELLPIGENLHSIGRLDRNTSGLLLITNDGALTNRLTHPSREVEKEYVLTLRHALSKTDIEALQQGVSVPAYDDEKAYVSAPAQVVMTKDPHIVHLVIHEGRKRQVRRMIKALKNEVVQLKRIRLGSITLGSLELGAYRTLTENEEKNIGNN